MKKKVKKLAIGGGLRITPAARPAPAPVKPAPVGGPPPFLDAVSPRRPPVNPTPVVGGQVRPKPAPTTAGNSPVPVLFPSSLYRPLGSAAPAGSTAGLGSFFGGPNRNSMGGGKPAFSGFPSTQSPAGRLTQAQMSQFSPFDPSPPNPNVGPGKTPPGQGWDYKKGGQVKAKKVSSASKRADGIAQRGKTKGRMV